MTFKTPVYLDYHATTPVDPMVLTAMLPYFTHEFGNPSSSDHIYGAQAAEAVEMARRKVARVLHAKPEEIIFTSGATESNNLALVGVMERLSERGNHLITCATEHKAVLETAKRLEKKGKRVTFLPVDRYGLVDPAAINEAITEETVLISIMAANNEIGTVAPIKEIGAIARERGVFFHTDAAQAAGHIPLNVEAMNIDFASASGHKIYGPKGVGALFIKGLAPSAKISALMCGGGQERGIRSGTLNVPGIVGLGEALEIAQHEMNEENKRTTEWTGLMLESFQEFYENVSLNGHPKKRLAHNLNVCFPGLESKALIHVLRRDLSISAGSACTTASVEPSHVLRAIGLDDNLIYSSLRFGLGRFNTQNEIEYSIEKVQWAVNRLRRIKGASNLPRDLS
jgi:cysteine desulfurase